MRILIILVFVFVSLPLAAKPMVYYRCYAEDGTLVLADRPCGEDAESLELEIEVPKGAKPAAGGDAATALEAPEKAPGEDSTTPAPEANRYSNITIVSPQNGEVVRSDDGQISVSLSTTPELQEGDSIQLLLDGREVAKAPSTRILITGVDKGRRTLLANVVDDKGNPQSQSLVIRFIRF